VPPQTLKRGYGPDGSHTPLSFRALSSYTYAFNSYKWEAAERIKNLLMHSPLPKASSTTRHRVRPVRMSLKAQCWSSLQL